MRNRTWRRFFGLMEETWAQYDRFIHPWYLQGIDILDNFKDGVPSVRHINQVLAEIGWSAKEVSGYAPAWEVSQMLHNRIMPISRHVRPEDELLFAKEPDLIHDVFGHIPALFSPAYRSLLGYWSEIATSRPATDGDRMNYYMNRLILSAAHDDNELGLEHLNKAAKLVGDFVMGHTQSSLVFDKAYFWIMEFGLVATEDQLKILGAGIVSSLTEWKRLAAGDFEAKSLVESFHRAPTSISDKQPQFLVARDEEDFFQVLDSVRPSEFKAPLEMAHGTY